MKKTEKICYSCGVGRLHDSNLKGRAFSYRDQAELIFDEDLSVPVCDSCGELFLNRDRSKRFSAVLERLRGARKRASVQRFVEAVDREFPGTARADWEAAFGLSRGYLSRLIAGSRMADTSLEVLLCGFAADPNAVLLLLNNSNRLPSSLANAISAKRERQRRPATPPHVPAVPSRPMMSTSLRAPEMRVPAAPRAVLEGGRNSFVLPQSIHPVQYRDPTSGPTVESQSEPTVSVAA